MTEVTKYLQQTDREYDLRVEEFIATQDLNACPAGLGPILLAACTTAHDALALRAAIMGVTA